MTDHAAIAKALRELNNLEDRTTHPGFVSRAGALAAVSVYLDDAYPDARELIGAFLNAVSCPIGGEEAVTASESLAEAATQYATDCEAQHYEQSRADPFDMKADMAREDW
jgi:hypothetical protein